MDTSIESFQADEKAAFTPKRGKIKPVDIISLERRAIDEGKVADLVNVLARDGRFLHPPSVRQEGATVYRLIAGHHRLEASKRHSGEQAPIEADIFPSDTPDDLITVLEIEENLLRKELTAAEREVQTIRLAAALKRLDGEKLETEFPVSASDAKSPTRGGRGKKALTAQVAGKLGLSKPAVRKRTNDASAAIGEKIDLDRDTPEELERKADKRQHAKPKVERPKRSQPALNVSVKKRTPPAEPQATEVDSQIEALWKGFGALGRRDQLKFIYVACLSLGLDPFKMAPAAVFELAGEKPQLAVNSPSGLVDPLPDSATLDDAQVKQAGGAGDLERLPEAADEGGNGAALQPQAEQQTGAAEPDAEDDDAGDAAPELAHQESGAQVEPQAQQHDSAPDLQPADLQDGGDDVPEAADPEIGVAKCGYCKKPFSSSDLPRMKYGQLYHRGDCVNHAKPIAIAA